MGYFKDISDVLAKKYPDRKVFVISDEHFDHKNIIGITRSDLFGTSEDAVDKMNEYIITKHNSVVGSDDIVIILGDFSFKTGIERLTELTSKLNGHKFLVMGNHDKEEKPDLYLRAGFEDVFLTPIMFNGDYYSHYPLNASKDSLDRPNTILYNFLCKEFADSNSGVNFHGHQHELINNGEMEKNVACEVVDYEPLFVGRTKSYSRKGELPFVDEEFFDVLHRVMSRFSHLKEQSVVNDYLYTSLLDLLSVYEDDIAVFGSVLLNKKYDFNFTPSDLDVTKIFNPSKSVRANRDSFKKFGNDVYERMIQLNGFNGDFYKKIDFICILSFIYATKKGNYKGYLDMNILLDEFYKSSDFVKVNGTSVLEEYATKMGCDVPNTIRYPKFNIQSTNALADVINCFLQYIYSTDSEKKKTSLVKMKKIMSKVDITEQYSFEELENMLIRYLLRNIYFFESTRRKTESDIILSIKPKNIEMPISISLNKKFREEIDTVLNNRNYREVIDTIYESDDKKNTVTSLLKTYKEKKKI